MVLLPQDFQDPIFNLFYCNGKYVVAVLRQQFQQRSEHPFLDDIDKRIVPKIGSVIRANEKHQLRFGLPSLHHARYSSLERMRARDAYQNTLVAIAAQLCQRFPHRERGFHFTITSRQQEIAESLAKVWITFANNKNAIGPFHFSSKA
jgi:hypothetical protein